MFKYSGVPISRFDPTCVSKSVPCDFLKDQNVNIIALLGTKQSESMESQSCMCSVKLVNKAVLCSVGTNHP